MVTLGSCLDFLCVWEIEVFQAPGQARRDSQLRFSQSELLEDEHHRY